jgi:twitching motility protein PilJ
MIASQSSNRNVVVLTGILLLVFSLFSWNIYRVFSDTKHDADYLEIIADMRVLSQQISTHTREATQGKGTAFDELERVRKEFSRQYTRLTVGDDDLPSLKDELPNEIESMGSSWKRIDSSSSVIVANKSRVIFLHEVASTLSASIPELQQKYNTVVDALIDGQSSLQQVAQAEKQTWRAERLARNVDKMLVGGEAANAATEQFNSDAKDFGEKLDGMLNGNAELGLRRVDDYTARQALSEIAALFEFINQSVDDISQASPDLKKVRRSADKIIDDSPVLMEAMGKLAEQINNLEGERTFNSGMAIFLAIVMVVLIALIGTQIYLNTRTGLAETKATNDRNQQAIMRLLDELADLADGDLTATATVSEDFTGAIADSINFTIDQLRILVSQINDTALRVSRAAEETQSTALHLAEASEHQAQEIAGASAAVNEMAVTIDQVSANAAESATVAERSVKIANRGAEVVQNTINGMDTIREQIQDTAKRIKRLGESSQEIGDIVSLINDIADQTNILALNAAIQASMAGDAGRGFAVVADEVQRLAERSSAATKQIEALVKTIQSDTNEAVISMEQTTAEVVRGARLAQDAGMALEEIEKVSQELAELIQNISNAARQQAASAGHISNTMNVIQEITQQTNAGTTATARSIGNLADMATDLRNSVAGFTLPDEVSSDREVA